MKPRKLKVVRLISRALLMLLSVIRISILEKGRLLSLWVELSERQSQLIDIGIALLSGVLVLYLLANILKIIDSNREKQA